LDGETKALKCSNESTMIKLYIVSKKLKKRSWLWKLLLITLQILRRIIYQKLKS